VINACVGREAFGLRIAGPRDLEAEMTAPPHVKVVAAKGVTLRPDRGGWPTSARRVVAVLRDQIGKVEIRYIRGEGRQAPGFHLEPPPDENETA
jgi:hypothetical protein